MASRNISPEGIAALGKNRLKVAHLVLMELGEVINYYTDYSRDIVYRGNIYRAGRVKRLTGYTASTELSSQTLTLTTTGCDEIEVQRFLAHSSFLGKKVIIRQAIINDDGTIVPFTADDGEPLIYYRGKIAGGDIEDSFGSGVGSSNIRYTISNDFYDFEQVNGRWTSDASHRGLVVQNGQLVPSGSAKRPEYQEDLGFFHSDKSVSVVAQYQTKELRYKMESKRKGGLGGLLGMKNISMQEYYETVTRTVSLDFNLAAKYLPVIYGTQTTGGIPVFCDTEKNNPKSVWVVYAVCEGEIEGFLDIIVDDRPLICYDDADDDARVCFGRKRINGDTMNRIASGGGLSSGPSVHGQEYVLEDPDGNIRFWTFHGLPNQDAAQVLVNLAASNNFRNQGSQGPGYYDSRMKLLDTAYVVVNYTITENRTNIPNIAFEVKGRKVRVYNQSGQVNTTKTSSNLVWQTLDYVTSKRFGPGVDIADINIQSCISEAAVFDAIDSSYDSSWCPFWRYLGWESWDNSQRKVLQTNVVLDTANSIFKNLQSLLSQGNMSLNMWDGYYYMSVETSKTPVITVNEGDILGNIKVTDTTGRNKYNSVQANIVDPAIGWKSNAVTFFNSNYLLEDKGVEKKLNLVFEHITNYYTARSLAERELRKSRYSREVTISLPYMYYGIVPNDVIAVNYPRYGFVGKTFLVSSIEYTPDCKFNLTLTEYDKDVFINSPQVDVSDTQVPEIVNLVLPPRNLIYTPAPKSTDLSAAGVNGRLQWSGSLSSDVVAYTIYQSGRLDPYSVEVLQNQGPGSTFFLDLMDLPEGNYTFEVRAVNVVGYRSKPAILSVHIDASKNLRPVTGFRVVNIDSDDNTEFLGGYMQFIWDRTPDLDIIPTLSYNFIIMMNDGTVLQDMLIKGQESFNYPLSTMKADYKKVTGTLGAYRSYKAKIRVVGTKGEQSVMWTEIN